MKNNEAGKEHQKNIKSAAKIIQATELQLLRTKCNIALLTIPQRSKQDFITHPG